MHGKNTKEKEANRQHGLVLPQRTKTNVASLMRWCRQFFYVMVFVGQRKAAHLFF